MSGTASQDPTAVMLLDRAGDVCHCAARAALKVSPSARAAVSYSIGLPVISTDIPASGSKRIAL